MMGDPTRLCDDHDFADWRVVTEKFAAVEVLFVLDADRKEKIENCEEQAARVLAMTDGVFSKPVEVQCVDKYDLWARTNSTIDSCAGSVLGVCPVPFLAYPPKSPTFYASPIGRAEQWKPARSFSTSVRPAPALLPRYVRKGWHAPEGYTQKGEYYRELEERDPFYTMNVATLMCGGGRGKPGRL